MPRKRTVFAGTGSGEPVGGNGRTALVANLSGTFVGTVALEMSFDDGANYDVYTSLTAAGNVAIANFPPKVLVRWTCSAYTSGSPVGCVGT